MSQPIYVLYRGDEIVGMGSKAELAKKLNVQQKTIAFYASPSNVRRARRDFEILVAEKVMCEE